VDAILEQAKVSVTRIYGHLYIRPLVYTVTCIYGHLYIRSLVYTVTRIYGHSYIRLRCSDGAVLLPSFRPTQNSIFKASTGKKVEPKDVVTQSTSCKEDRYHACICALCTVITLRCAAAAQTRQGRGKASGVRWRRTIMCSFRSRNHTLG
jgi:hypothetical protein